MSINTMSNYIVYDSTQILGYFDNLDDSLTYLLNNIINNFNILINIKNLNGEIKLPNNQFKIDLIKNNIINYNSLSYDIKNNIIHNLDYNNLNNTNINKIKILTSLRNELYNENNDETVIYDNVTRLQNDNTNSTELYENNEDDSDDDSNHILELQKKKIQELLQKKIILENIKKKNKEKEEEISRRFEVDYNIYMKLKDTYTYKTVPEIFRNQYPIFKDIENTNKLEDKIFAKEYYTLNFNKINKNLGSNIFTNIFNQNEPEEIEYLSDDNKRNKCEHLNDDQLSDNDQLNNIESDDILYN